MKFEIILGDLGSKRWSPTELHTLVQSMPKTGYSTVRMNYATGSGTYPWYRWLDITIGHSTFVLKLPRHTNDHKPVTACGLEFPADFTNEHCTILCLITQDLLGQTSPV